jgi:lysozyme
LGYHTVRYGETLMCIGRAYAVSPWAIASHNGLAYPYRLSVGRRLSVPNVPWKVSYGPVCARQFGGVTPPPPPPPGGFCRMRYVVRWGDTLYAIAWRFRTSVWVIVSDNNLPNANLIFAGQVLCIR